MRTTIGLMAALLGLWAPWAQAQVAAPELAPAGVRIYDSRFPIAPMNDIVPENPAAMQWGAPSRIGGGVLDGAKSDSLDGAATSYNGSFGGFRWVRQRVALGVETSEFAIEFPGTPPLPPPRLEKRQSSAALSFSWPASLAMGLAAQKLSIDTVNAGGFREQLEFDGWVFGLSWRLGEHVFVGGGFGQEEVRRPLPVTPGSFERDHSMLGLGLRGGGTLIWRLEADTFHRDDFKDNSGLVAVPGYDLNQFSAEGILGSWLLGATGYELKFLQSGAPTVSGYSADVGYAPLSGLTLTWRFEHSEKKSPGGVAVSKEEINNAVVTWQF